MNVATAMLMMILLGATPAADSLSDEALLQYASERYDKAEMMDKHVVLGVHRGTRVVVDFPCSDLCPDYTVRVIRYDLVTKQSCSKTGGVWKSFRVPEGIASVNREFCFPKVIADHWDQYAK